MRVALVCTPSSRHTQDWVSDQLLQHDHVPDGPTTVPDLTEAAEVGHGLADRWRRDSGPDVVVALGWEAGLAAQVATRAHHAPVVLRLTQPARVPGSDRFRLETALARTSNLVLVPSVGELDRLVDCGIDRAKLRVLPDAVDRSRFADTGPFAAADRVRVAVIRADDGTDPGPALPGVASMVVTLDQPDELLAGQLRSCAALVVVDDSDAEVALALRAMSCGVPVVAVERGVLADLVADGVTGLLARPDGLAAALRSVVADPLRRESMGLAAVDRVRARFATDVVGAALARAVAEVHQESMPAAASM